MGLGIYACLEAECFGMDFRIHQCKTEHQTQYFILYTYIFANEVCGKSQLMAIVK